MVVAAAAAAEASWVKSWLIFPVPLHSGKPTDAKVSSQFSRNMFAVEAKRYEGSLDSEKPNRVGLGR